MVQIWSRNPPDLEGPKLSNSTVRALRLGSNHLFQVLHLQWRLPESVGVWYDSRRLKKRIWSHSEGWGTIGNYAALARWYRRQRGRGRDNEREATRSERERERAIYIEREMTKERDGEIKSTRERDRERDLENPDDQSDPAKALLQIDSAHPSTTQ